MSHSSHLLNYIKKTFVTKDSLLSKDKKCGMNSYCSGSVMLIRIHLIKDIGHRVGNGGQNIKNLQIFGGT